MRTSAGRIFVIASTLLVAVVVIVGVYLTGSPREARVSSLDRQRIEDLTRLSGAVESYNADHRALPPSLVDVADAEPGIAAAQLRDPETRQPYEYRTTGENTYELCASFGAASDPDDAIRWRHGVGRKCFEFTAPPPPSPARGEG